MNEADEIFSTMKYMSRGAREKYTPITAWIVTDLETTEGRKLLQTAITHIVSFT